MGGERFRDLTATLVRSDVRITYQL